MCGIAGVLSRSGTPSSILQRMLSLMAHRGPDGDGEWNGELPGGGEAWLGHRRLSILDLRDLASQPMQDPAETAVLVFNGEIYNYVELRSQLAALGVAFRTTSDTEVLLEAYKAWGEGCLARLNGMFAFAIWEPKLGRLFAARDRFGEKPFYFVSKPHLFAFASEIKALLILPDASLEFDEIALLRFGVDPALDGSANTPFRDICQLGAGEMLTLYPQEGLNPKISRWYNFEPRRHEGSRPEREVFAEFRELLVDAVRLRMRSDVPVGSCLSGGLDSSAIVGIARELLGPSAEYNTFTGVFPGTYADEAWFADLVVEAKNTKSHRVEPTAERFLAEKASFLWYNELPVGSASQFAQWCVFAAAKEAGVTVLLDGQGADEGLGGYEQYFRAYVQSLQEVGEQERLAREHSEIRSRYPKALSPPLRNLRDRLPFRLRHFAANRLGVGSSLLYLLTRDVAARIRRESARPRIPGRHALGSALQHDSFGRVLPTLLRYGDRNSMAHSREVRLPFCDHRITEFALGLPPQLLMGEVQTKRLLRESLHGILPESIRTRWNKQGFLPPQDLWFADRRFLEMARDTITARTVRENPHYQPGALEQLLERISAGAISLGWTLWHPLILELWREHFVARVRSIRDVRA